MKQLRLLCLTVSLAMTACASVKTPNQPSISSTPTQSAEIEPASNSSELKDSSPATAATSTLTSVLTTKGRIQDARLNEISGLAGSNYRSDFLWALNDSGNAPELYRINTRAELVDVWAVNVNNRDWEAMASVVINGKSYLLIAETGDNLQVHKESRIHIVLEPSSEAVSSAPLIPVNTLRFQYEGGPRNVEAMSVSNDEIVLLTKERLVKGKSVPSQIFRLPLTLQPSNQTLLASNIGSLALPARGFNIGLLIKLLKIDPVQPTDLSISANGQHAYVLNYVHLLHYERASNESWLSAFSRKPKILNSHGLRQAEALTVNALGEVWLTSEKQGAPLMGFKAFDPPVPFN